MPRKSKESIENIKPQEQDNKSKTKSLDELLSSDTKIGEFVKREKEINEFEGKDFNFNNKEQFALFCKSIEEDEQFKIILKNIDKFLNKNGEFDLLDSSKMSFLKQKTEKLPLIQKYVILAYLGAEYGIKMSEENKGREWWIQPSKTGGVNFPYRISTWHNKDLSNAAIEAFSLEEMYTSWDEETALSHPLEEGIKTNSSGSPQWMDIGDGMPDIVAKYLKDKGILDEYQKLSKEKLDEKLKQDKNLLEALEKSGFSEKELKTILGSENLFENYETIQNKVDALKCGERNKDKYFVKDNKTIFVEDFGGASDDRGWDVRIKKHTIHILGPNVNQAISLPPYFRYEDFPGGVTTRDKGKEIKQIKDIQELDKEYIVSYLNGEGKKESVSVEKKEEIVLSEKNKKKIEETIKDITKKWLSPGNLESIALAVHKLNGVEKMGNYPYFSTYKMIDEKLFLALVKIIDAERYDELLIDGREQGTIYNPDFKTEVFEMDLKSNKHKSLGEYTTDRNETNEIGVSAVEYDNKVEFSLKPEILLSSNGKITVNLKVRGEKDKWVNLVLFGKK